MNIRGLDLSLLVIFHALLKEGHVSRAAHRAGLTQPARSNALERCRRADPRYFLSKTVREEWYVLALPAAHPVTGRANCEGWLDHPHVVVSAEGAIRTPIDEQLADWA